MSEQDLVLVPWQGMFFTDQARYRIAVCGRRSGKTTVARAIIYSRAFEKPNNLIWYVAPTYKMAKNLMFKKLVRMIPRNWIRSIDKTNLEITLKNGTEICCKGSDNTDSLLGEGIHLLILDEYQSQSPDVWWTIRPTLSDHQADVVIIGTPRGYDHFHELWFRGAGENPEPMKGWSSYQITTAEAGTIPQEEIDDARLTMSSKQFNQEYNASFTSLSGVVYDGFDPLENVRDELSLTPLDEDGEPTKLTIRIGMDFNINPMTAIVGIIVPPSISISGEKEAWIVDEVFLENSNTREMITYLHGRYGAPGEKDHEYSSRKKLVYPDPAGGARNSSATNVDSTNHTLLQDGGFLLKGHDKGHPAIVDSVNEVNALLCNVNQVRRMYVHPRCSHLINPLKGLTYKNNTPDKDSNLDHMSDCLRYFVHNEFPINKGRRMVKQTLL